MVRKTGGGLQDSARRGEQSEFACAPDGLATAAHAEFAEQVGHVLAHARPGHAERGGDLSVALDLDTFEDIGLARGQPGRRAAGANLRETLVGHLPDGAGGGRVQAFGEDCAAASRSRTRGRE